MGYLGSSPKQIGLSFNQAECSYMSYGNCFNGPPPKKMTKEERISRLEAAMAELQRALGATSWDRKTK